MKKTIKIDRYNQKILAILHLTADLTNVELAEQVNLSPSACFQRVKALKEAEAPKITPQIPSGKIGIQGVIIPQNIPNITPIYTKINI